MMGIGEKVTEWCTEKTKDLLSFKTGKLDSNAAEKDGKYPFFTCAQETFRISKYAFDTECVLLAGNNAAGIFPLKYFKGKFNAYQRTYIIEPRDREKLDVRFLYYALLPFLKQFEQLSTGATTKFLTLGILNIIQIPLPPQPIQQKIAAILSVYDDFIENNNRRIAILEKIAEEIYREWFVRMRFPGHEKAKFHKGVPEGWEVIELKNIARDASQSAKPGSHLENRNYLPLDLIQGKHFNPETHLSFEEAQSSLVTFEKGDILFGAMRPYLHKVCIAPFDGITRTTCFVIRPKIDYFHAYLYLLLFQNAAIEYATLICNGSDRPYVVWNKGMEKMKVLEPSDNLVKEFESVVGPIIKKVSSMYFTFNNLKQSRDLLLSRLITGKLSVEDLDIHFPPSMRSPEPVEAREADA